MKRSLMLVAAILLTLSSFCQIENPVQWTFGSKKVDATSYEVSLTATIEPGWHIYSQTTPDGGPIATNIEFTKNPLLIVQGAAKEVGKLEKKFEPLFGVDVKQFSGKVIFKQIVKLKGKVKTSLNGQIEFMSCNDHECLPPKVQKFSIALQ